MKELMSRNRKRKGVERRGERGRCRDRLDDKMQIKQSDVTVEGCSE